MAIFVPKTAAQLKNVPAGNISATNVQAAITELDTEKAPALGVDDNYVTDAEKIVIGNTSGTNTGDNATNSQYSGLAASKQNLLVNSAGLVAAISDETGSGLLVFNDSPVFTTQISTPKIVTASGDLTLLPASYIATLGDGTVTSATLFYINGGGNTAKGAYLGLRINSVTFGVISNEAVLIGSGTSKELCFFSETGLGMKWMVNGSITPSMTLSSAGVLACTSPVFTTQISTPKIVTASGGLNITPTNNEAVTIGDGTVSAVQGLIINGGTNASKGAGISFKKGGVPFLHLYDESAMTGAGTSNTPCFLAEVGLGFKLFVNGGLTTAKTFFITSDMNVGIGIDPTARLHLPAGSTVAGTAPKKYTSGPLLSVAEVGAIEFLTDAWYGTITTGAARKTFAFLESPVFTTPNIGSATGSISGNAGTVTNGVYTTGTQSIAGEKTFTDTLATAAIKVTAFSAGYTIQTGASYAVAVGDYSIVCNSSSTLTIYLPTASANSGRILRFKTITLNAVVANSSDVVPLAGGSPGTAILPASSDGSHCSLQSDGSNWITMELFGL